jgi:hypothetical protein
MVLEKKKPGTPINEEVVNRWLQELKFKSLERTDSGKWFFLNRYGDDVIQVNIGFYSHSPPTPPMLQIGSRFLDKPGKFKEGKLFKRLLQIQNASWEAKFGLASNGDVVLVVQRTATGLTVDDFQDMLSTLIEMYKQFHPECQRMV